MAGKRPMGECVGKPPPHPHILTASLRGDRDVEEGKIRGAKKTLSKTTNAMGDDAKQ